MAYEVVKNIRGRRYRYRVQSERDAVTGKARNRWTYLGRVAEDGDPPKPRAPRANSRLRLIEAAQTLLAGGEAAALTVDAIVAAAGVAHGTFYRYFRDRSACLTEVAAHIRATRGLSDDRWLRDDVGTLEEARRGIRRWMSGKLQFAREDRPTVVAWNALLAGDARLSAHRSETRAATLARLTRHIEVLNERGYATVDDPRAVAAGLIALGEGIVRSALLENDRLDDAGIAAAAEIADRALFARADAPAPPFIPARRPDDFPPPAFEPGP